MAKLLICSANMFHPVVMKSLLRHSRVASRQCILLHKSKPHDTLQCQILFFLLQYGIGNCFAVVIFKVAF